MSELFTVHTTGRWPRRTRYVRPAVDTLVARLIDLPVHEARAVALDAGYEAGRAVRSLNRGQEARGASTYRAMIGGFALGNELRERGANGPAIETGYAIGVIAGAHGRELPVLAHTPSEPNSA